MPRKKSGMPYVVYPTPGKKKDGKPIVCVKPLGGLDKKLTIKQMDALFAKYSAMRSGELTLVLGEFLHWASEQLAKGYRVETPIGSFVPKLRLKRNVSNPDEVTDKDVELVGVEYNQGKLWKNAIGSWLRDGFMKVDRFSSSDLVGNDEELEKRLRELLKSRGYVTVNSFKSYCNMTYFSARKQLNEWTEGVNPKLLKSKMGQTFIYTEI